MWKTILRGPRPPSVRCKKLRNQSAAVTSHQQGAKRNKGSSVKTDAQLFRHVLLAGRLLRATSFHFLYHFLKNVFRCLHVPPFLLLVGFLQRWSYFQRLCRRPLLSRRLLPRWPPSCVGTQWCVGGLLQWRNLPPHDARGVCLGGRYSRVVLQYLLVPETRAFLLAATVGVGLPLCPRDGLPRFIHTTVVATTQLAKAGWSHTDDSEDGQD